MNKLLAALFLAGCFAIAPVAQAATLTAPQVDAIVALLVAFGVEQPTIDIVYAQLSPKQATTSPMQNNDTGSTANAGSPQDTPAGASAPTTLEASFASVAPEVYATGYADQVLATLHISNNTGRKITLGGDLNGVLAALNLSVSGPGTIVPSLLYTGFRNSQEDLTDKPVEIVSGDRLSVGLRLKFAPGTTGTITLQVGSDTRSVSVIDAPAE